MKKQRWLESVYGSNGMLILSGGRRKETTLKMMVSDEISRACSGKGDDFAVR